MSENITIGEFLSQTFKRWWEIQRELGRIKTARIERQGTTFELPCFFGSFSLRERESLGTNIPLDTKKASFKEEILEGDKVEIEGKNFKPIPIAEIPWGDIKEYVVALEPNEEGQK
jgi:hypothetical protein